MTTATRHAPGAPAPDDRERSLFAAMLRLRRFEEKAGMLYALGTLATPCPVGIGREGAVAAIAATIAPGDIVLAPGPSPAIDVALGDPMTSAFQRLLPDAEASVTAADTTLRLPGEALRHLPRESALAAVATRPEPVVLIASRADDMNVALGRLGGRVLPLLIVSSDRKDELAAAQSARPVRECDGADASGLCDLLAEARQDAVAGHAVPVLALVTPPYAGHARDPSRRTAPRRDTPDPIVICRQRLANAKGTDETGLAAIEAAVRDEVAVAGRAIALACT